MPNKASDSARAALAGKCILVLEDEPLIALDLDLFGQIEALPAVVSIIFRFRRRLPSLLSKHLHIPSNLRQIVLGPDEVFLQGRRSLSVVP